MTRFSAAAQELENDDCARSDTQRVLYFDQPFLPFESFEGLTAMLKAVDLSRRKFRDVS